MSMSKQNPIHGPASDEPRAQVDKLDGLDVEVTIEEEPEPGTSIPAGEIDPKLWARRLAAAIKADHIGCADDLVGWFANAIQAGRVDQYQIDAIKAETCWHCGHDRDQHVAGGWGSCCAVANNDVCCCRWFTLPDGSVNPDGDGPWATWCQVQQCEMRALSGSRYCEAHLGWDSQRLDVPGLTAERIMAFFAGQRAFPISSLSEAQIRTWFYTLDRCEEGLLTWIEEGK